VLRKFGAGVWYGWYLSTQVQSSGELAIFEVELYWICIDKIKWHMAHHTSQFFTSIKNMKLLICFNNFFCFCRSSMQRDVLDNLPRPAPPPYAPHTTSMYCEDDGTYLVWTIEIRFRQSIWPELLRNCNIIIGKCCLNVL
jgi:hypothetical protein